MEAKSGIERALERFENSPSKLAAAVGNGVIRQHVEHWLKTKRVPAEKCPEVAAVSGVALEDLNDKVNWKLARRTRAAKPEPQPDQAPAPV